MRPSSDPVRAPYKRPKIIKATESNTQDVGERCQRCGESYREVYWADDNIWDIASEGKYELLCMQCLSFLYSSKTHTDIYWHAKLSFEKVKP